MKVVLLCVTLCDPMDYGLPGYYVHGSFQARVLEWIAISFSRVSSRPGNRTQISHIAADALTSEPPGKTSFGLYRNEKGCFYLIFNSFTEGRLNTDHSFCLFFLLMFFYLAFPPIIICFIFWLLIHHFSVLLSLLNLIFISYKSFIHLIQPEPFNMYHFHQNSFIICYWFVLPSPFPLPFYC